MNTIIKPARDEINLRHETIRQNLANAIAAHEWSKLAGLSGMLQALTAAGKQMDSMASLDNQQFQRIMEEQFASHASAFNDKLREAVKTGQFESVAGLDGKGTGWLMALKAVRAAAIAEQPTDKPQP